MELNSVLSLDDCCCCHFELSNTHARTHTHTHTHTRTCLNVFRESSRPLLRACPDMYYVVFKGEAFTLAGVCKWVWVFSWDQWSYRVQRLLTPHTHTHSPTRPVLTQVSRSASGVPPVCVCVCVCWSPCACLYDRPCQYICTYYKPTPAHPLNAGIMQQLPCLNQVFLIIQGVTSEGLCVYSLFCSFFCNDCVFCVFVPVCVTWPAIPNLATLAAVLVLLAVDRYSMFQRVKQCFCNKPGHFISLLIFCQAFKYFLVVCKEKCRAIEMIQKWHSLLNYSRFRSSLFNCYWKLDTEFNFSCSGSFFLFFCTHNTSLKAF